MPGLWTLGLETSGARSWSRSLLGELLMAKNSNTSWSANSGDLGEKREKQGGYLGRGWGGYETSMREPPPCGMMGWHCQGTGDDEDDAGDGINRPWQCRSMCCHRCFEWGDSSNSRGRLLGSSSTRRMHCLCDSRLEARSLRESRLCLTRVLWTYPPELHHNGSWSEWMGNDQHHYCRETVTTMQAYSHLQEGNLFK